MNRTEELRQECVEVLDAAIDEFEQHGAEPDGDFVVLNYVTAKRMLELLKKLEAPVYARWHYYTNDEGKARWRCTNCGHVVKHDPNDFKRCACGAHMSKEA